MTDEELKNIMEYAKDKLDKMKDDIHDLFEENKQLKEKIDILLEDNNQLEEIRIKAIDKIKNTHIFGMRCGKTYLIKILNELLEILGGKE